MLLYVTGHVVNKKKKWYMILYDMIYIWNDMIYKIYGMIYDMTWYMMWYMIYIWYIHDTIYDMIRYEWYIYEMIYIWYYIWYMIWHDMIYDIWCEIYMTWYVIWYHMNDIWYDIYGVYVNCKWVVTRWQQYSTHLHTNNTQNNTKLFGRVRAVPRLCGFLPWHLPYNWRKSTEKPQSG